MSLRELTRITVIGAGAIGGAVIDRLLAGGFVRAKDVTACEPREERRREIAERYHVAVAAEPGVCGAELIVLAMPPRAMAAVLDALRGELTTAQVLVSFAGAVPLTWIEARIPSGTPVVRVNPNSPSIVGAGFNPVVYGRHTTGAARARVDAFLAALGSSPEVPDARMNLYTALTAVGPTYVLPVVEALIDAGLEAGLAPVEATRAAIDTARGTLEMVARRAEDPARLKLLTGLRPLQDAEVRRLVREAVHAALTRMDDVQRGFPG